MFPKLTSFDASICRGVTNAFRKNSYNFVSKNKIFMLKNKLRVFNYFLHDFHSGPNDCGMSGGAQYV